MFVQILTMSAAFFVLVVACSCINAFRYLKRTNIMDVVREEHRNEPVKQLGRWCGPLGFLLVLAGAVMGYSAPGVYMNLFHAYPNALLNLLYAPVFAGLYLIMLHTVTHGWHIPRKNPYKNLISRSMKTVISPADSRERMPVGGVGIGGNGLSQHVYHPVGGFTAGEKPVQSPCRSPHDVAACFVVLRIAEHFPGADNEGAHQPFGNVIARIVIRSRKVLFQNVRHDVVNTGHRMMFGNGIGVSGVENGEIGIAEIIELLPVFAVLGDDGTTVHFRTRSSHREHAADRNPPAGHFPEVIEIILPRVLLAVGMARKLKITENGKYTL